MVLPTLQAASADPVLLVGGRSGASSETRLADTLLLKDKRYFLHLPTKRPGVEPLQIVRCQVAERDQFRPSPGNALLVALSIGSFLDDETGTFIYNLADEHKKAGAYVCIAPCENRLGPSYMTWLGQLRHLGCHVMWSVVDRICFTKQVIDGEMLYVSVEHAFSWIVRAPDGNRTMRTMADEVFGDPPTAGVRFVDNISPYQARKARLVNGSHLALGLMMGGQATPAEYLFTNEFIRNDTGFAGILEAIHAAYIESLLHDYPNVFTRRDLASYAEGVRSRLYSEQDTAERIMRRLTADDVVEFLRTYLLRVHQPVVRYDPTKARELSDALYDHLQRHSMSHEGFWQLLQSMSEHTKTLHLEPEIE
jgi:hypothetical protein